MADNLRVSSPDVSPYQVAQAEVTRKETPPKRPANAATKKPTGHSGASSFQATDDYKKWERFAQEHNVPVKHGKVTVIGVRDQSRADALANTGRYEDKLVVLKGDGTTATFDGNTKPSQQPTTPGAAPHVDGDGVMDLGMIRPGNYKASSYQDFAGRPSFKVETSNDKVPGWRDTDHDGKFSKEEKRASEARGDTLSAVRIHVGFDESGSTLPTGHSGKGPTSVGCQNVPDSKMDGFVQAVGGRGASFNYSVVEAPVERAETAPAPKAEPESGQSGGLFDGLFGR